MYLTVCLSILQSYKVGRAATDVAEESDRIGVNMSSLSLLVPATTASLSAAAAYRDDEHRNNMDQQLLYGVWA